MVFEEDGESSGKHKRVQVMCWIDVRVDAVTIPRGLVELTIPTHFQVSKYEVMHAQGAAQILRLDY